MNDRLESSDRYERRKSETSGIIADGVLLQIFFCIVLLHWWAPKPIVLTAVQQFNASLEEVLMIFINDRDIISATLVFYLWPENDGIQTVNLIRPIN